MASKQASKQASTKRVFSRSHALEGLVTPLNHLEVTSGEDKTVSYLAADTLLTDYRIFKTVFSPPTLEKSVINLCEGFC